MQQKKQNFVQGAVILMAASLVVKVIGAFFQIPLQNLIGGESSPAFGLFSAAYRIYTAMLVISTVGLPAALSKMVAEATAFGREREVRRIVRVAAGIFVPVGLLATLALLCGAETRGTRSWRSRRACSWSRCCPCSAATIRAAPT